MSHSESTGHPRGSKDWRVSAFKFASCLLILRVTIAVVFNYRKYFPPDFYSDFLLGREGYFWGNYRFSFYTHIVTGPMTLLLGPFLLSDRFRIRFRGWHRRLGKVQTVLVVLFVAPSGMLMAVRAPGMVSGIGFGALAVSTWLTAVLGWRLAVKRKFAKHRLWMWRCYLLLCSAVVLRIMGGLATVFHYEGETNYAIAAWASWLIPLIVFESIERHGTRATVDR